MKSVRMFKGMKGTCVRQSGNSPFIENNEMYKGDILVYPTVGVRFICGALSTNIVVEIVVVEECHDNKT